MLLFLEALLQTQMIIRYGQGVFEVMQPKVPTDLIQRPRFDAYQGRDRGCVANGVLAFIGKSPQQLICDFGPALESAVGLAALIQLLGKPLAGKAEAGLDKAGRCLIRSAVPGKRNRIMTVTVMFHHLIFRDADIAAVKGGIVRQAHQQAPLWIVTPRAREHRQANAGTVEQPIDVPFASVRDNHDLPTVLLQQVDIFSQAVVQLHRIEYSIDG